MMFFIFVLFRGTKAELELELPMVQVVQVGKNEIDDLKVFSVSRRQSFRMKKILMLMYLQQ